MWLLCNSGRFYLRLVLSVASLLSSDVCVFSWDVVQPYPLSLMTASSGGQPIAWPSGHQGHSETSALLLTLVLFHPGEPQKFPKSSSAPSDGHGELGWSGVSSQPYLTAP